MKTNDKIRNEERGGMIFHVCVDCRRDAHEGRAIRHSSRCSTPAAQATIDRSRALTNEERKTLRVADEQARIAKLAKAGEISRAGLTENEIVGAVNAGVISMSDAMNRDF